jgi:hypothetical protein
MVINGDFIGFHVDIMEYYKKKWGYFLVICDIAMG